MRTLLVLSVALLPLCATATIWQVGQGLTYTAPSQVSTLVGDGDTVDIEAGIYPSDVARWTANDLVLRGVGGLADLESNGMAWGGKAIWVIQGDRTTVERIAFRECSVPDNNGAGIRQEGHNLTVRHCQFHNNENGILAGTVNPSTITVEHCEFGTNGFGDGFSHNLYINNVDSLIFRFNYSHHAVVGHELKSRAHVNIIAYNRFSNEANGTASREIDLPNGGAAYLFGNVIQQGPQGQNSNMVGYGLEGLTNPGPHELYAINNTLVNEKTVGSFFQCPPAGLFFKAFNNILAGGGSFMNTWPTVVDTLANLRITDIVLLQFADPAAYDFHITTASPADGLGYPAGVAFNGYPLVAEYEYVHPADGILRCQQALLDVGAFETCTTTGLPDGKESGALFLFPNPATDQISLVIPEATTRNVLQVLDAKGRTLSPPLQRMGDRYLVDVSALAPGLYHIRFGDARTAHFVKL